MTYYRLLGVAEDATSEAIHSAFRSLARQYHPDAGEGSSAGKFRDVVEAYETLGDPARRHAYDKNLARERAPAPRHDVVVEPLAQPWFSSPSRTMNAQPATIPFMRVTDDWWFEEMFRSFEEFFRHF